MIHKDSGLVSRETWTGGLMAPLLLLAFFGLLFLLFVSSLTRSAGIELLTVMLE